MEVGRDVMRRRARGAGGRRRTERRTDKNRQGVLAGQGSVIQSVGKHACILDSTIEFNQINVDLQDIDQH